MGIPIGWNIRRPSVKDKDVLRADVTGQRSPIRRRPRHPSLPSSPASLSAVRPPWSNISSQPAPPLESLAQPSHVRTRLPPPPAPELSRGSSTRPSRRDSSRNPPSLHRETTNAPHNDFLRYRRYGLPPLPDLTPGFAPAAAARLSMATDRETSTDSRHTSQRTRGSSGRAGASERLARSSDHNPDMSAAPLPQSDFLHNMNSREATLESSSDNAVGFPPLRRMGRRHIADGPLPSSSLRESWSPASTLDGLGDRERSPSTLDEQLPWQTFLSTVVPDPVAPTAESSFASAAASASFSASHPSSRAGSSNTSASTSATPPTEPSDPSVTNEQFMHACDTSEEDPASDTEAEEEDSEHNVAARLHGLVPIVPRRRSRPSYFSDEPLNHNAERYSRRVMDRSRDAREYVRSYYSPTDMLPRSRRQRLRYSDFAFTQPPELGDSQSQSRLQSPGAERALDGPLPANDDISPTLTSSESLPLDQELREARALLDRLSRREDVSDDFWASVGLTRSFADGVERLQNNERD